MNVALAKIDDLDKKQTTALPMDVDNFDISDLFPIVDLQHLAIVEEKLENKHLFNKYVSYFYR